MPHLLEAHGGGTLMAICTLLLILPLMFSAFAEGWSPGTVCTKKDISIVQGPDGHNSGVPQYAVQIVNNCISSCAPWDIHVYCGWFASSRAVNSNSFQRLGYNDCLVNGGKGLRHGEILSFTYANSRMYPMRLKSACFCK